MIVKKKLLELESLRGLAAVAVAISHLKGSSLLINNGFIDYAFLMVDFFFVLSGFVIAMNYQDYIKTANDLKTFMRKRFWRLYPLHFLTLLGALSIEFAKYAFERKTGITPNHPAFEISSGVAFVHNLFLTHSFLLSDLTFNFPSWSISTEFYTYLIFAFVIFFGRSKLITISILIILISFYIIYPESKKSMNIVNGISIFRCTLSFFLGVLCYSIYTRLSHNVKSIHILPTFILSILAVIYLASDEYGIFVPLFFCVLIIQAALLDEQSYASRILHTKPLVYLGTISYSVYMTHSLVWWVVNNGLRFVFKVPTYTDENGSKILDISHTQSSLLVIFTMILVIAISHFTYLFIENRFRKGVKRKQYQVA